MMLFLDMPAFTQLRAAMDTGREKAMTGNYKRDQAQRIGRMMGFSDILLYAFIRGFYRGIKKS